MAAKVVLVVCAQALLVQICLSQAIFPGSKIVTANASGASGIGAGLVSSGFGASGFGSGLATNGLASSGLLGVGNRIGQNVEVVSGGPLLVTAISPIGPSGLAVACENALEGVLTINGQLPYLSAVAFEGSLPTAGAGTATCGCGSGNVGITSEGFGRGFY